MEAMEASARAIEAALPQGFSGDAHALLVSVYKDESRDIHLRIDAAKAAIRYEKPALSATELKGDENKPLTVQTVERIIVRPKASDPNSGSVPPAA